MVGIRRFVLSCLITTFLLPSTPAQAPPQAVGPGSTSVAIALRGDGGIVVAGTTQGSQAGQPSQGGLDAFVAWLTPSGELERVSQFGSQGDERIGSLLLDPRGNIYLAGDSNAPLPFATGSGAQFVTKLTADGQILWTTSLGGDRSYAPPVIALDRAGNLIVAGSQPNGRTKSYFRAGERFLYDAYVATLTPEGDPLTHYAFAVDETQVPTDVLPLADGTLIVLGRQSPEAFSGDSAVLTHGFAARLSSAGTVLEHKTVTYPGDGTGPVRGLRLDQNRIAITLGTGMGVGEPEDRPAGVSYYAAIGILDQRLEPIWFKSFGKAQGYIGAAIAVTPREDLILVGYGNGDVGGTPQGLSDVFLGAYTADGARLWLEQYGTSRFDRARAVVISPDGTILVTGSWDGDWEHILRSLKGLEQSIDLGTSWFVAAHGPGGERLWMRTFSAADPTAHGAP